MKKIKIQKGFTLIEILIAVAIMAILSATTLALVTNSGARRQADLTKVKIFDGTIKNKLVENMVGDWSFDETSGSTVYNYSDYGNDLNGAFSGTPTREINASCVSGQCLSFNGTDGLVVPYNSALNVSALTVSGWVKLLDLNDAGPIISRTTSTPDLVFSLYYDGSSKKFQLYATNTIGTWNGWRSSSISPSVNQWYFVVGMYSPTGPALDIYIQGVKDNGTLGGSIPSALRSSTVASIGIGNNSAGGDPLSCFIDDVRMYGVFMSIAQVQQNYLAGLNKLLANNGITQTDYNQRVAALERQAAYK
jgi:prepilin-type N-terminal cleavage/methylation domain-containing protein